MYPKHCSYGSSELRLSIQLEHWRPISQIVSKLADLIAVTYTPASVIVTFYYGNLTHPSQDQPRVGLLSTVPPDAAQRLQAAVRFPNATLGDNLPCTLLPVRLSPISLIFSQRLPRQRLPALLHLQEQILHVLLTLTRLHRFRIIPTWLQTIYDHHSSVF